MGFIARTSGLTLFSILAVTGLACDPDEPADDGAADTGGDTGGGETTGGADTDPITTTLVTSAGTLPGGDEDATADAADDDEPGTEEGPADTTDDGGDTGQTDDDTTGGGAELDCTSYCDIYMDACSDYSAYANVEDCMDNCAQWPLGTMEDTAGDSLGCRIYHVTVASSIDPSVHCPHAGPNGDLTCVDDGAPDCDTYCSTYMSNCTGDNNVFADMNDCMQQCEPWYQGTDADIEGNTVGCRIYHAGAPAFGDPETHCPHAGPGGAGVCSFPG